MSVQATLPTEEEILEAPEKPEEARGLVPRAGLFIAIGLFVVVLLGFAFYDLAIRKPAAPAAKSEKPVKPAPTETAGQNIAPGATIAAMAEKQERTAAERPPVPAAVAASAPASASSAPAISPMVAPPNGVRSDGSPMQRSGYGQGADSQGQQASDNGSSSAIFAISGEGGSDGQGASKTGFLKTGTADPAGEMIRGLEEKLKTVGAGGGADAELLKAAMGAQGQARTGKDQQWLKDNAAEQGADTTFAKQPAARWLVFQGTRVPVVVREAINSDLPGPITAITTAPVFDSIRQCGVLIPVGTRLIGSYSADIRAGQSRVLLGFTRMIFPDGRSLNLNGAQGVDQIGAAGIEGDVNNHWFKRFGYSFALGLLSSSMGNGGTNSITVGQNGATTTTTVAGQVIGDISRSILSRDANIPPTISLDVGSRLFVTMVRDLALQPVSTTRCP